MLKVHILDTCTHCNGEASHPIGNGAVRWTGYRLNGVFYERMGRK